MKRILFLLLATVLLGLASISPAFAAPNDGEADQPAPRTMKIALISDDGGVADHSFNQAIYEACRTYAQTYGTPFVCFQPVTGSDAERAELIQEAAGFGCNVIVTAGSRFSHAIRVTASEYPDAVFLALDLDRELMRDYTPPPNLYGVSYREEYCGYMAGYAAVHMGYRRLGFLGGRGLSSIRRYGYGFIEGADTAAEELGLSDVTMNYVYADSFEPDDAAAARMEEWYRDGTEVIFVCGGGIYTSVAEAAAKTGGQIIGVDVDQSAVIDNEYGQGMTVTSAIKDLGGTVRELLEEIADDTLSGGHLVTLGLRSADPEENYIRLPLDTTQWNDQFTREDYRNLVAAMYHGQVKVNGNTMRSPASCATVIEVDDQGVIH